MIKKLFLSIAFVAILLSSYAQSHIMTLEYDLTTEVSYSVSEAVEPLLDDYDRISLMPTLKVEHVQEKVFPDGHSEVVIEHSFPNGMVEDWLFKPVRTEIDANSTRIYGENNELYTEIPNEGGELIPAIDFTAYYYASPPFTTLDETDITMLTDSGYTVSSNTNESIIIFNDNEIHYYSPDMLMYEYTELENGIAVYRKTVGYVPGQHNDLVYDFIIEKRQTYQDSHCVDKVIYKDYDNLVRTFFDPLYAPQNTVNPGGTTAMQDLDETELSILAYQVGSNPQIKVSWDFNLAEEVTVNLYDLYGKEIISNYRLNGKNSVINLDRDISTGVYILKLNGSRNISTKIIYRSF